MRDIGRFFHPCAPVVVNKGGGDGPRRDAGKQVIVVVGQRLVAPGCIPRRHVSVRFVPVGIGPGHGHGVRAGRCYTSMFRAWSLPNQRQVPIQRSPTQCRRSEFFPFQGLTPFFSFFTISNAELTVFYNRQYLFHFKKFGNERKYV